jgi:3D (Asp-Asp-Asp) domain-containing protein
MKIALKILFFSCLTILCLFVITKNKEIKQYKIQEQHNLYILDTLQLELDDLRDTIKDLLNQINDMQRDSTPEIIFKQVKATMYHPVEAQCDDTPLITADGSKIDPYNVSNWNWIAVSQHMLKRNGGPFDYGDTVYVFGTEHKDGMYIIKDCMNKRKTNQIDFLESLGTPQYRYDNVVIARFPQENLDS